ncbi:MAG: polyprenyl synthetase family protein [Arenicella sp.]
MVTNIATNTPSTSDIKPVLELVADDMQQVNSYIKNQLNSDVALINQLSHYIVQAGGKRLRPVSLLLCSHACSPETPQTSSAIITLAAIIEFIHTATLLHDDVVDESSQRRGKDTANEVWGNAASVLVGDFLYSRAFEMMVEVGSMRVMEVLAKTTNQIAEGEVMQLLNIGSADTTEEQYFSTIHNKTAILFASATQLGAIMHKQSQKVEQAMQQYGQYLGTAFQLVDDILDYTADASAMGKNVGDDLAEGKPTLPLINALQRASSTEKRVIEDAINNGDRNKLDAVLEIIESTGSLAYTARKAQEQIELAHACLSHLPDSPYRTALEDLANFSVARTY